MCTLLVIDKHIDAILVTCRLGQLADHITIGKMQLPGCLVVYSLLAFFVTVTGVQLLYFSCHKCQQCLFAGACQGSAVCKAACPGNKPKSAVAA